MKNGFAIAISSGTLKGVFAQGVLSALEHVIEVDAYACASSSVISGTLAALGRSNSYGLSYWQCAAADSERMGMSDVVQNSIKKYGPDIKEFAFRPGRPRLLVAVSKVMTPEAAELTQGPNPKKIGKRLLLQSLRRDSSWVDNNLEKIIFDSQLGSGYQLISSNFDEVAYASTRMLHEWDIPATINGEPFIDASYTCSCPAYDLMERGYRNIIVIDSMPGETYESIFRRRAIKAGRYNESNIFIIKPEVDLVELGVDYTSATQEGIGNAYNMGYMKGEDFLENLLYVITREDGYELRRDRKLHTV